ncbi:phospholipid carrier-dependent glycosyltransferase [Candidatus Woesearchaeota archaeon]|nr:phospholipid carrier-dependent glycosyltransferase [Candidatus Woesearchaeota archaeon]
MSDKDEELKIPNFLKDIKINYSFLILALILIFGFYLRSYHADYPVIGYHAWKEMHYLTEARNFAREGFFKHGFFIPYKDIIQKSDNPDSAHSDTFPISSIITAIGFKMFGMKLKIARMISIFFSLGSVIFFYLIIKKLFDNNLMALLSAFLLTLNPLLVFFGRQVQLINPALFFCLGGVYFYLLWLDKFSWKYTILFPFFLMLGIISKYSFAIFVFPMLGIFPFKKFVEKKLWPKFALVLANTLLLSLWIPYVFFIYQEPGSGSSTIASEVLKFNFNTILTDSFWTTMVSYTADNYSLIGLLLAFLGFLAFEYVMISKVKDKSIKIFKKIYFFSVLIVLGLTILGLILPIINTANLMKILFYTMAFFIILGSVVLIYYYIIKDNKETAYRFISSYTVGFLIYVVFMAFKMSGHNYHQYPIMPLLVFFMAYFMIFVANTLKKINMFEFIFMGFLFVWTISRFIPLIDILFKPLNAVPVKISLIFFLIYSSTVIVFYSKKVKANLLKKVTRYSIIIIFVVLIFMPSLEAKNRMFNTQFIGWDIAGDFINQKKEKGETLINSGHQARGVVWHADIKGSTGIPKDISEYEKERNAQWLFFYQWDFSNYFDLSQGLVFNQEERSQYIKNNYRLVQFGFEVAQQNQIVPVYMLFKKGGTYNLSTLNQAIQSNTRQKDYELTSGKRTLYYTNLE